MHKIFKYLSKKQWLLLMCSVVFIVAQVWLDLKMPDYMSEVTVLVQTEGSAMSDILKNGAYMLLCALCSMISAMAVVYLTAQIGAGLSARLRGEVFSKTLSFSMEEINGFSTSSLITRCTNDVTQVQMLITMGLQSMVKAPILATWAIIKIIGKSWQWSMATAVAVVVLLTMLTVIITVAMPRFKKIQGYTDNINRITRENLTGLRVVRAYNAEKYQEEKFDEANTELTNTHLFVSKIMALMNPTMTMIMSGMSLAIYWIGAYLIDAAEMNDRLSLFSDMVVFSSYSVQVIMAFMLLSIIFIMMPRASVSARRIMEVLDTEVKIKDSKETVKAKEKGTVVFNNVSFKYPDAGDNVIENISFEAKRGETVAFIGATGSGKSTLINLIPRFYDVSEGEVLLDGVNVKDYKLKDLREKIGYVSQKAFLFSGNVKDNVVYGASDKSIENVKEAVDVSQASEFIEKMENSYEGFIAQGGSNVSGGQKQRLSIARAVAKKPEIYIFDDSFSALDYKTDRQLRAALKEYAKESTLLIVAQRIGTIKNADKIVVMHDGKIAGIGKHEELLKNCEIYKDIAYSQLSEEELKNE